MLKKFLFSLQLIVTVLSASAYEIGEFTYTKVAKYKITGENLVVNGKFTEGATGFGAGWVATDATNAPLESVFTMVTGGPNSSNSQKVIDGQTDLTKGMYQKIAIKQGGTYVVSFWVMGTTDTFTDLDLTGRNTNYMNAYYNTDGALATADGTELYYGTNGVNGGYGFDFGKDYYTEAVFAINAPTAGYIVIDFRGLSERLEIADVQCHQGEEIYDDRIARNRITYFKKFLTGSYAQQMELYESLMTAMKKVETAIETNSSEEIAANMNNLELMWTEFVAANFKDFMAVIPTIDGSANTGNNSANWMNWTSKYNHLNSDYTGKAPWTWSTDRWCHKTSAANNPLEIQWQRYGGVNNQWNNIATLTTTLTPGTYYWGVSGQGGMMTLNKNRWARSWANECAETKLFFNDDTVFVGILNPARNEDYVVKFELKEEREVKLGIICNNVSISEKSGFDVQFYSPILYKLYKSTGSLTPSIEISNTLYDKTEKQYYKTVTCIPKNYIILDGVDMGVTSVYYTTDGTVPTSESTRYTKPINCYEDMTIKFQVYDPFGTICEGATIESDIKINFDTYTDEQGVNYELNTMYKAYTVTDYVNFLAEDVTIPDTLFGQPVKAIEKEAFADASVLKTLTIPATVNMVGDKAFSGCHNMMVMEWNATAPMLATCFDAAEAYGNMLVFTNNTDVNFAGNVVVNGQAEKIALTDGRPFRNPQAFTAKRITYTREFSKKTRVGMAGGWEGIILPFDVQLIYHEGKGSLAPFGHTASASTLPCWMAEWQQSSMTFVMSKANLANQPFIMEVPNSDEYDDKYNIEGTVTFSAENATVHATTDMAPATGNGYSLQGTYEGETATGTVYALNDMAYTTGSEYFLPGGVFVANARDIRPFEAYIYNNQLTRSRYLPIQGGKANDMDEMLLKGETNKENDAWYTLQGVRLNGKPMQKGLYIHGSRVVRVR